MRGRWADPRVTCRREEWSPMNPWQEGWRPPIMRVLQVAVAGGKGEHWREGRVRWLFSRTGLPRSELERGDGDDDDDDGVEFSG